MRDILEAAVRPAHRVEFGTLLSRLALAGQRFVRLGSCFVVDFCRKTGNHFCEICLASIDREADLTEADVERFGQVPGRIPTEPPAFA